MSKKKALRILLRALAVYFAFGAVYSLVHILDIGAIIEGLLLIPLTRVTWRAAKSKRLEDRPHEA